MSDVEWFRSSDGERLTGLHAKTGERLFWIAPSLRLDGFDLRFYFDDSKWLTYLGIKTERACVDYAESAMP